MTADTSSSQRPRSAREPTDCLLAVFDEAAERTRANMLAAYRGQQCWVDGVRASLLELLRQLELQPRLARLVILAPAAGELPLLARRERILDELAQALEAGRPASRELPPAPFGAEAVIGAVAAILHGRLLDHPSPQLLELARPLMAMIVLPYLGVGAAQRELDRDPAQ